MKAIALHVLAIALLAAGATAAAAQDSATTRTLFSKLPFRGVHVALGGGAVPYLDHVEGGGGASELKIMFALRDRPDWSVGFSTSAVIDGDSTSWVAPGSVTATSPGFHPDVASVTNAAEVQRRWRQAQMIHAIATLSIGSITNSYSYIVRQNGRSTVREDEKRTTPFGQVGFGAEVNVARWLRVNMVVGYRSGGRMVIPEARGSNGGITSMMNLAIGKF